MTDAKAAAIQALIEKFQRSGVRELHLKCDEVEIYLSADTADVGIDAEVAMTWSAPRLPANPPPQVSPAHDAGARNPVPPAAAAMTDADWPAGAKVVRAPYLGTFYRAPKPGAASFVEIGSLVSAESELCLVEVMKLFTTLRAGVAGKVHAILAKDGALVDAEQPLFVVLPS